MAVLTSCCCCHSVRKGSFLSAIYTLIYFSLFSCLSGLLVFKESINWLMDDWDLDGPIVNDTISLPMREDEDLFFMETPSGAHPFVVVDFGCEVAGIIVSIILLCGLKQERKSFLIPWMVVVPLHTLIDACTVIYIIIDHCTKSRSPHTLSQVAQVVIFILVAGLLNTLNTYVFLCVVSQYQEYNDGRGTAAYEGLFSQQRNSDSANYMNPMRDLHSMNSGFRSPNQRRTSQKSDTWNDDSGMNTTDVTPVQGRSNSLKPTGGTRRSSGEKNHVVRFGNTTCDGDVENGTKSSLLKPGTYSNARSSLSEKSTHSSSGVEDSTAESVAEL